MFHFLTFFVNVLLRRSAMRRELFRVRKALNEANHTVMLAFEVLNDRQNTCQPDDMILYHICYDSYLSKHHNSPRYRSIGDAQLTIEGGIRTLAALKGVRSYIQNGECKNGMICTWVRIQSIKEINRWKKEMTPAQEATLRQKLGQ